MVLSLYICLLAQSQNYQFRQLSKELGLSQQAITSVVQDQKGFLWLGSWLGLMRYDGYAVKIYKQETGNSNGLQSNKITTVYEDAEGNLWIGTRRSGLYFFDSKTEQFINYDYDSNNPNALSNDIVYSILEDNKGRLWIGTENGLNLFDKEKKQFTRFKHDAQNRHSLSDNFVGSVCLGKDNSVWIGTRFGLNRLIEESGKYTFQRYYFDTKDNRILKTEKLQSEASRDEKLSRENFIYEIKAADFRKNALWIGTKAGVKQVIYDSTEHDNIAVKTYKKGISGLSHNIVQDILEVNGKLWIATLDGLNLLDLITEKIEVFKTDPDDEFSLSNNAVISLYKDQTDILWIGTEKGINRLQLRPNAFQNITFSQNKNDNSNIITSIAKAHDAQTIWLGTRGSGLNAIKLDGNSIETYRYDFPNTGKMQLSGFITNMMVDNSERLWLATNGSGIIQVDTKDIPAQSGTISKYKQYLGGNDPENIGEGYVMCIAPSNQEDFWIGLWDNGLNRYDAEKQVFRKYLNTSDNKIDFTKYPIVALLETQIDDKRLLWMGTRGNGVYQVEYSEENDELLLLNHFSQKNTNQWISNDLINQFHKDKNNTIWVATENGINHYLPEENTFKAIKDEENKLNLIFLSMQSDDESNLWCSTHKGLVKINVKVIDKPTFKFFDAYYNLDSYLFNNSTNKLNNGSLLFGGLNGATLFNPKKIERDTIAPKVTLVDFRLFNQSISVGEKKNNRAILPQSLNTIPQITLKYNENNFTFQFAALHYAYPEKNQFMYKLEGYDKNWIQTDANQRVASYTNLDYKTYTFKVKAANYDGIWSEVRSVKVEILPPFWLTSWAILCYVLVIIGLLYLARRVILIQANLRNKVEIERVKREKLEEVDQLKTQFFTNISHELRTPLTLIVSPLEELVKNSLDNKTLHQTYQRMYKNANRLLTMINQLLDIRKSEAGLLKLNISEQDFIQFIKEATLSFEGLANSKNIDLQFQTEFEQINLWFDPIQMEKVIFNLLSNAIKFTPNSGQVTIEILQKQQNILLKVSDTGVGIPKQEQEYIFDRFYQVEKNTSNAKGTGIGLALTKNIVEQHKGKIKVQSTRDKGSAFTVFLKLGNQHFTKEQIIKEPKIEFAKTTILKNQTITSDLPKTSNDSEKDNLLIVEDNPDIRQYLKEHFQKSYNIEEAENGKIGLEKALTNPPNLIISDIAMPEMDGIALCKAIKQNVVTSHIPVVLLTARTSLLYKLDGFETGADDYITKPFNISLLAKRIANIIENRKRLQEKFSSKEFSFKPAAVVVNSLDEEFLSTVKATIENNIDNTGFSVEALSKSLLMSSAQLYRKTKALTGKTPIQLIRTMRMQRAAQLLETGNYAVSEVTYMVGFQDLKYFRQRFKKEFGVNPSVYGKKSVDD